MNKKFNIKSFTLGVCLTLVLTSTLTVTAQSIDVFMGGIKVYWESVEKILRDTKGEKVEPIIYNGTTYVPLRAMSNLMGKDVDWNQSEKAVYVGKKPTAKTYSLADMEKNINGSGNYYKTTSFYLKNQEISITDGAIKQSSTWKTTYVLDNKFSSFRGKMVMPYTTVGSEGEATVVFYSVENDGTANEIETYRLKKTEDPIEFEVDLRGVTNLRITAESGSDTYVIYDASFLGE